MPKININQKIYRLEYLQFFFEHLEGREQYLIARKEELENENPEKGSWQERELEEIAERLQTIQNLEKELEKIV